MKPLVQMPASVLRQITRWGQLWGLPDLGSDVHIVFSNRLRSTLARCRPLEGRIVVRADLARGAPAFLVEVLCHEAAHIATHKLHGHRAKPHGAEWKELVRLAGYSPSIRAAASGLTDRRPTRAGASRIYEHRCPVCQVMRLCHRPVTAWRCAGCIEAGLSGVLVITCLEPSTERRRGR